MTALENLNALDPAYPDVAARLEQARTSMIWRIDNALGRASGRRSTASGSTGLFMPRPIPVLLTGHWAGRVAGDDHHEYIGVSDAPQKLLAPVLAAAKRKIYPRLIMQRILRVPD